LFWIEADKGAAVQPLHVTAGQLAMLSAGPLRDSRIPEASEELLEVIGREFSRRQPPLIEPVMERVDDRPCAATVRGLQEVPCGWR
jgi:hypothetical protein